MNKKLAILAAGAVTVASAVPALAFENQFNGLFRVRGIISNFDNSSAGNALSLGTAAAKPGTSNYIEQRARLLYTAKASDDLKLVTHFEIDSRWGDASYNQYGANSTTSAIPGEQSTLRNAGGGVGADQVNLETKNVYLDFNIPGAPLNAKLGIQGYTDPYKGIIFNNDAAGLVLTSKMGNFTGTFGYFRFDDATTGGSSPVTPASTAVGGTITNTQTANTTTGAVTATQTFNTSNATPGFLTRDFITLGGKYAITKDIKVGADYYMLYSDVLRPGAYTSVNTIGLNAEAKVGPATIDGFYLQQFGRLSNTTGVGTRSLDGFAANVGAKMAAGPGTVRCNVLYLSGDGNPATTDGKTNAFQTILERGATTAGHTFFPGEMQILLRSKYAIAATDKAIAFDLNNGNKGFAGAFFGYDLNIGKAFVNSNLGLAAVAHSQSNATPNYLGTEVNTEIGYKLYDNLTTSVLAAYLFTGGFYAAAAPENPYSAKLQVNYTF